MVDRGSVWLANLDPVLGNEIRKARPCLIVSPTELNQHLRTVTIAPMTTASYRAPFRIPLTFQGKAGHIALDQLRTVDKRRLVKLLGKPSQKTLSTVLSKLQEMFSPS